MTEHVPSALDFQVPAGTLIPTRVLDASRVDDAVVLLIEVGQEEWQTIDLVMLFNLTWNCRNAGDISGNGTVRILMQLNPKLADRISTDDVMAELSTASIDDELRSTTSWYGLEVTEAVPLPPALAAKGEVRQGFTTTWRTDLTAG